MKRFALAVLVLAFGAVAANAGDHSCCKGAKTADCKEMKMESGCPHSGASQAKVDAKLGKCPVSGEPASAKVSFTYEGTTYHFCCKDCIKDFKANPAKFSAKTKS